MLLLLLLLCYFTSPFVEATTIYCGKEAGKNLCTGQEVLLQCNTTNPFLEWDVPFHDCKNATCELDFNNRTDVGKNRTFNGFTAVLLGKSGAGNLFTSLMFTMKSEYNNSFILCFDGYSGHEKICNTAMAGTANRAMNITGYKQYHDNSLLLSWDPPLYSGGPNIPIDHYDVTVSPPPSTGICSNWSNCSVTNTTITLHGLKCQSYSITIQPINCVGPGSLSNTSTLSERSGKVCNLDATVLNERSIILQWDPPSHNGGEHILYYLVSTAEGVFRNTTQNSLTIGDLSYGEHNFSVQAVNCHGEGYLAFYGVKINYLPINLWEIVPPSCTGLLLLLIGIIVITMVCCCKRKIRRRFKIQAHSSSDELYIFIGDPQSGDQRHKTMY